MSKAPAPIAQVNVSYQREEDRLLLKIRSTDNAEYRLWLTRRYTQLLLGAIEKLLAGEPEPGQTAEKYRATRAFEHERITASADLNTPYEENAESFPLGAEGVLGYRISIRPGTPASLQLQPRSGAGVSLPGLPQLLHNLYHLLRQAAESADWKLAAGIRPGPEPTGRKLLN